MRNFIHGIILVLTVFVTIGVAQSYKDNREADANAIRASIESITQAFIDGDIDKIYYTHSKDWTGFLDGTPNRPRGENDTEIPLRGIDEYMKGNGITKYPRPADAKFTPNPNAAKRGFKIYNFDVNFVSPDIGVANFILDFVNKTDSGDFATNYRLRIMDVYAKRDGGWVQVASNTVVDPKWTSGRQTMPATNVPPQVQKQILDAREAVWRAWFSNDRAKLEEMIPEEAIAIDSGGQNWENRAAILAGAKTFADSGAKLVRLEFPRTEMQIYGNIIILYTSYIFETEKDGKKNANIGNGIETFVRRNGKLVNTGWILASGK